MDKKDSIYGVKKSYVAAAGVGLATVGLAAYLYYRNSKTPKVREGKKVIFQDRKGIRLMQKIKGVFAGSGSDAFNDPRIVKAVLDLSEKSKPNVLYLGTACYDIPGWWKEKQTKRFIEAGCQIDTLEMANEIPSPEVMSQKVNKADIILVSGGNTLYAFDKFVESGLKTLLREAVDRGCIFAGGSAGAIIWFDSGHSDSADPESWKAAMLGLNKDEGTTTTTTTTTTTSEAWEYIHIPGLGFLPGLLTPHYDKVQSNGILRAVDSDKMILKHSGERLIGIDHWAALIVNNGNFKVLSLDDKEGSVLKNGCFSPERKGVPGVWIKDVVDGEIVAKNAPKTGKLEDLLRKASSIVEDDRINIVRSKNT